MTESTSTISCPNCGTSINVQEALSHQAEEAIKKQYSAELLEQKQKNETELIIEKEKLQAEALRIKQQQLEITKEKESIADQIEKATKQQLQEETKKLTKQLREQITNETAYTMQNLQDELDIKSKQVQELAQSKSEVLRLKREKDELESSIKLRVEQAFHQQLSEEKEKLKQQLVYDREELQKQLSTANELKLREKDEQLSQLSKQLQEAQRKAEQGSTQLQGEVQELAIEEWLRIAFPLDSIEEIQKGHRGADCMQIVHTREIQNCGKIYYESKRTKEFSQLWIEKFKTDMREKGADIGVLITSTYPKGSDRLSVVDGIWICSYDEFKSVVPIFRQQIIRVSSVLRSQENRVDKMHLLYNYLTSNEFKMQVEAIFEGFSQLQSDLDSEKRAMQKIWKKREKQLEKVLINTTDMYGSIQGIAGNVIGDIKYLELIPDTSDLDFIED